MFYYSAPTWSTTRNFLKWYFFRCHVCIHKNKLTDSMNHIFWAKNYNRLIENISLELDRIESRYPNIIFFHTLKQTSLQSIFFFIVVSSTLSFLSFLPFVSNEQSCCCISLHGLVLHDHSTTIYPYVQSSCFVVPSNDVWHVQKISNDKTNPFFIEATSQFLSW